MTATSRPFPSPELFQQEPSPKLLPSFFTLRLLCIAVLPSQYGGINSPGGAFPPVGGKRSRRNSLPSLGFLTKVSKLFQRPSAPPCPFRFFLTCLPDLLFPRVRSFDPADFFRLCATDGFFFLNFSCSSARSSPCAASPCQGPSSATVFHTSFIPLFFSDRVAPQLPLRGNAL